MTDSVWFAGLWALPLACLLSLASSAEAQINKAEATLYLRQAEDKVQAWRSSPANASNRSRDRADRISRAPSRSICRAKARPRPSLAPTIQ